MKTDKQCKLEITELKIENEKIKKEFEIMKSDIIKIINENCEMKKIL